MAFQFDPRFEQVLGGRFGRLQSLFNHLAPGFESTIRNAGVRGRIGLADLRKISGLPVFVGGRLRTLQDLISALESGLAPRGGTTPGDTGFNFGRGFENVDTEALNAALQAIYGQNANFGDFVRGRNVNVPDIRRLIRRGGLTPEQFASLQPFLDALGLAGISPRGGGAGGGGGGGGGGTGGGTGGDGTNVFGGPGHGPTGPFGGLGASNFSPGLGGIGGQPLPDFDPRDIPFLPDENLQSLLARLDALLNAERQPVEFLPADQRGMVDATLAELLEAPGLPEHLLQSGRNMIRENLSRREMNLLERQKEVDLGDRIFGSGPARRNLRDIEDSVTSDLADQLTALALEDARAGERARQLGLDASLRLGQLGLGAEQLSRADELARVRTGISGLLDTGRLQLTSDQIASQEALAQIDQELRRRQLEISELLGLGGLDIEGGRLELDRQTQEFLQNFLLLSEAFGLGGGGDDGSGLGNVSDIRDLLDLFRERGGFFFP